VRHEPRGFEIAAEDATVDHKTGLHRRDGTRPDGNVRKRRGSMRKANNGIQLPSHAIRVVAGKTGCPPA
jgi:hypothetical protein